MALRHRKPSQIRSFITAVITTAAVSMTSVACVSINIPPQSTERSSGVVFQPPPSPYSAMKSSRADGAWQNEINGNSISFLSTCNDPADPDLDSVSNEIFAELRNPKIIHSKRIEFNAREALDTEVEGAVDGILTKIHAIIFKKNGCIYTISQVGLASNLAQDRGSFETFLKNFKAP